MVPRSLRLRFRLPDGRRLATVVVDGRRIDRYDRASATIDLQGRPGRIEVVATTVRR
jgi:hypothetical protein